MYLTIDSTEYQIPFVVIGRKADKLFKYAERTEDGILHSELIGVYYNYDVQMSSSVENYSEYVALWQKITDASESYEVVVPDESLSGFQTFDCYFANIKDDLNRAKDDGTRKFRNLTFSIIAISPAVTP